MQKPVSRGHGRESQDHAHSRHHSQAYVHYFINPAVLPAAQILAGKAQVGLVHRVHSRIDKTLDVGGGCVPGHGNGAEGVNRGLNQYIGNGKYGSLHACGKSDFYDSFQLPGVNPKLLQIQLQGSRSPHQALQDQKGGDVL